MSGKRLFLGVVVTILGVATFGSFSSAASGQSAQMDEPGVVYGGEVRPARLAEVDRFTKLGTGAEYEEYVPIRDNGTFRKTIVDDYRYRGTHFVETQIVTATVTAARVVGTIEGKVKRTTTGGQVVRCSFGSQRWSAVN